jgi:hypothetical protein
MRRVRGAVRRPHPPLADLMSSGFWRATADLLIHCDVCFHEGWTPAIEDYERMSLTWTCPGCGRETEEDLGHDEGH